MPLEEHDPNLAGLEAALAALAPMPGRIDRDALLFRAGQASVPRRGWAWPGAAATLGVLAATLGALLAVRPAATPVERVIHVYVKEAAPPTANVPDPAPVPSAFALPSDVIASHEPPINYLQLEKQIMRWGLEAMPDTPETQPPSGRPLTRDSLPGTPREPTSFTSFFDLRSVFQ